MTLSDLKKLFRQTFPIVAGGPTNVARSRGAIACFDAVVDEVLPALAQQANQLATLGARAANLYAHYADNSVAPFDTLDDYLAAANAHGGTLRLEGEATVLSITKTNRGGWPAFWDGQGSTIVVPAGESLKSSAAGVEAFTFGNFYLDGGGTFLLSGQLAQNTPAGSASRLFAGFSNIPLDNPANVVLLDGGYYKKITGAGKFYLLGSVQVDDLNGASNVVDLRGGTGPGAGPAQLTVASYTAAAGAQPVINIAAAARYFNVTVDGDELQAGVQYTDDGAGKLTILPAATIQGGEVVQYCWLTAGSITPAPAPTEEVYTNIAFTPNLSLDMAASAQLLSLPNNISFTAAVNKARGRKVRVFLYNTASTAVTLSFPSDWRFIGPRPGVLAAGMQAVLTLESPRGGAETDILAGYASEL